MTRLVRPEVEETSVARLVDLNPRTNRFSRFLLAGAVNTLFGFAAYSTAILARADVWLALLIGTVGGTAFNFLTTGGYVFRDLSRARVPRFVLCYLAVYGVNYLLIRVLSTWVHQKLLLQFGLAFPMALLSYFLMSRFVFTKRETTPAV